MKPKSQSLVRYLALSAVALTSVTSHAADVTLTGSSAINGMNTNYTVNSPDALILDITGVGGNRAGDTMGAAIAKSGGDLTIDGNGTLRITGGSSDVLGIADVSGRTINISLGSGGLIDIQGGAFVNGGWGGGNWSSNLADMNIASGAIFDVWDGSNNIRVDALTGAGSVQNGSNSSGMRSFAVGVDGGSGTFSGVIGGGTGRAGNNRISLTKEGAGTQILSGNNTYAGTTTVSAGTLQIGNGGTTGSLGSGNVSITGNLTFNRSDNYGTGSSQVFTGAGTITKEGAGNLVFNGGTDHTNVQAITNLVVNNGLVRTDNWGKWNSNLNLTVNGSGKFEMWNGSASLATLSGNGTVQNTKDWSRGAQTLTVAAGSFSGSITDLGITSGGAGTGDTRINLVKSGAGTLTLSGANGYNGTTNVNDNGTLVINGNISTSSLTTVASSATLAGTGTVGATTVNGTFAPGDGGIESLAIVGNLTLNSGSFSLFEINTAGDLADLATATAAMAFGGTLSVTNIGAALANGDVFNLFDWGTTASGTFSTVSLPGLTGDLTWDQSQLYTNGTITVVPEPAAALLGGLGMLCLLRRRR